VGQGGTDLDTVLAAAAHRGIPADSPGGELQCLAPAVVDALQAADAFIGHRNDLYVKIHAFGIMAPMAGQRTAFEEYGCPDVRAIMERIPLNGKNCYVGRVHNCY
jgi:hypothetical protein